MNDFLDQVLLRAGSPAPTATSGATLKPRVRSRFEHGHDLASPWEGEPSPIDESIETELRSPEPQPIRPPRDNRADVDGADGAAAPGPTESAPTTALPPTVRTRQESPRANRLHEQTLFGSRSPSAEVTVRPGASGQRSAANAAPAQARSAPVSSDDGSAERDTSGEQALGPAVAERSAPQPSGPDSRSVTLSLDVTPTMDGAERAPVGPTAEPRSDGPERRHSDERRTEAIGHHRSEGQRASNVETPLSIEDPRPSTEAEPGRAERRALRSSIRPVDRTDDVGQHELERRSVHITIGRIEVAAPPTRPEPKQPSAPRRRPRYRPPVSLDEYLGS